MHLSFMLYTIVLLLNFVVCYKNACLRSVLVLELVLRYINLLASELSISNL